LKGFQWTGSLLINKGILNNATANNFVVSNSDNIGNMPMMLINPPGRNPESAWALPCTWAAARMLFNFSKSLTLESRKRMLTRFGKRFSGGMTRKIKIKRTSSSKKRSFFLL